MHLLYVQPEVTCIMPQVFLSGFVFSLAVSLDVLAVQTENITAHHYHIEETCLKGFQEIINSKINGRFSIFDS